MNEPAALERGYRRLLAWYPRSFRAEQEDEILAVLMAGAEQGQRRPRFTEAADLLRSALRMRLFPARLGTQRRGLADGLAGFSLMAPLFLLAVYVLQALLPYRRPRSPVPFSRVILETSGTALLGIQRFDISAGLVVILVVLVLLGLRRLAALVVIPAILVCFASPMPLIYWIPDPLVVLTAGVLLLEFAALLGSPGPRHGRGLVSWRYGLVLVLAAASFQAFGGLYALTAPTFFRWTLHPGTAGYLIAGTALAVAALAVAVVFRLNRFFLLAFAVACYPCALQFVFNQDRPELFGNPSPGYLIVLFGPPALFALGLLFTAAVRRYGRAPAEPAAPA